MRLLKITALLCLVAGVSVARASSNSPTAPFDVPQGAFSATHIVDTDHLTVMSFSGNYNRNLDDGSFNAAPRAVIAREFYRTHPDNYDFLVVFSTFEFDTGEAQAFHLGVRNDVEGIGLSEFDNGELFGSEEQLQSYIDMGALTRYEFDPLQPGFAQSMSVLSHEVLHRWGVRASYIDNAGEVSDRLLGRGDSHWSFFVDSNASVEYGHQWRDNGDGTFTAEAARRFYSPTDLYYMGLYSPEEVPDFFLINPTDSTFDADALPAPGTVVNGTREDISIDDIIAHEGPRVPASDGSERDYRMAFIALVAPGETLSDRDLASLNQYRNQFAQRFSIMTGGRGLMHVYPEALPVAQLGAQTGIAGASEFIAQSDLDLAISWLRDEQNPIGFWSDTVSTDIRDTVEVSAALSALDGSYDPNAALNWLRSQTPENTDSLARALLAEDTIPSTLTSERNAALSERRNDDGGWGLGDSLGSTPLDTALVLQALSNSPTAAGDINAAASFLIAAQDPSGAWAAGDDGALSLTATVQVIRALLASSHDGSTASIDAAVAWMAAQQLDDGGFGDSGSSVHETSDVGRVMVDTGNNNLIDAPAATAYVLARQREGGDWEGSVYTTAMAVRFLQSNNLPNLSVSAFNVDNPIVSDGELVRLSATVTNLSPQTTPATDALFLDGLPGGSAIPIGGRIQIPELAPYAGVTLSATWDSLDLPGEHVLALQVDPDGLVSESSRTDNVSSRVVLVETALAGIDLSLAGAEFTVEPQNPAQLPTPLSFTAQLRNLGNTLASNVRVRLYQDSASGPILEETVVNIAGRSSVAANFTHTLTQPGTTNFFVVADPDNAITETNESNNQAQTSVTPSAVLDLEILSADISYTANPAILFQDTIFSVRVRNRGTLPTPTSSVEFTISDGVQTQVLQTSSINLEPGEEATFEVPWGTDFAANLFTVILDPANDLVEANEANNVASVSVQTQQLAGLNLATSFSALSFDPNPALEGLGVSLSGVVTNTGTIDVTNVQFAFYDGDPGSGGVRIGDLVTIPSLVAGSSMPVNAIWSAVPDGVDRVIFAMVDPANSIVEFDEEDNLAFADLDVESLPDLAISDAAVAVNPQFPKNNDEITISVAVTNAGMQVVDDVVVRAYLGSPEEGGQQIGSDETIASLGASSTDSVQFSTTLSMQGEETIVVVVDPDDAVVESTESNNRGNRRIVVQDGNFFVTERYISPDGNGVKDATSYFFRLDDVDNPQSVSVVVLDGQDGVVRRFDSDQHNGTSVIWDGRSDQGGVVLDGTYRLAVEVTEDNFVGPRFVIVDTNRSALVDAIDTRFGFERNLSCSIGDVLVGFNTQNLPTDRGVVYGPNDQFLYFRTRFVPTTVDGEVRTTDEFVLYPSGLYRASVNGGGVTQLVAEETLPTHQITHTRISSDGELLVVVVAESFENYSIWSMNSADGSDLQRVHIGTDAILENIEFLPGTQTLVVAEVEFGSSIKLQLIDFLDTDPEAQPLTTLSGFTFNDLAAGEIQIVPNASGTHFIVGSESQQFGYFDYSNLLDSERHFVHLVARDGSLATLLAQRGGAFAWSPSGAQVAVADVERSGVVIYDTLGVELQAHELPTQYTLPPGLTYFDFNQLFVPDELQGALLGRFAGLSWNPDGSELAFLFEDYAAGALLSDNSFFGESPTFEQVFGDSSPLTTDFSYQNLSGVHVLNVVDNTSEHVALTAHLPYLSCGFFCFSYHVSVNDGGDWRAIDELHFDRRYSNRKLPLGALPRRSDGVVELRIEQVGHEEAHIDAIALLDSYGRGIRPLAIKGPDGPVDIDLLLARDKRVVDALGKSFTVEFAATDLHPDEPLHLELVAREATLSQYDIEPFSFPSNADSVDSYRLSLLDTPDPEGGLQEVFSTKAKPDTGHPAALVTGFIGTDGERLLGRLEFGVDNTVGNPADWAAIEVKIGNAWREFRVTEADERYGHVLFDATEQVTHEHKQYLFDIPLTELGGAPLASLDYRFRAYGSAGLIVGEGGVDSLAQDEFGVPIAPDGRPYLRWIDDEMWFNDDVRNKNFEWVSGTRAVLVSGRDNGAEASGYLVSFGSGVPTRRLFGERELARVGTISQTPRGGFLSYFSDDQIDACPANGRSAGYRQFESLLNLTADVRAIRSPDAGGIQLTGTAADANFMEYRLDFATVNDPENWQPIAPPAEDLVVNKLFTTWVPPGEGNYFVRLTAVDLAGNERQSIRNASLNEGAAITDLYRTPANFSPNGDGSSDGTIIHFRVLEPVNLDIQVINANGDIVRTITQSFSQIGSEHDIVWDGRDDDGVFVADGDYELVIQNFRFEVTLDTQAPVISVVDGPLLEPVAANALIDSRTCEAEDRPEDETEANRFNQLQCVIGFDRSFEVMLVGDPNARIWLESRPFGASSWSVEDTPDKPGFGFVASLSDFNLREYRVVAEDAAGNRTIVLPGLENKRDQLLVSAASLHLDIDGEIAALPSISFELPGEVNDQARLLESTALGSLEPSRTGVIRMDVAETVLEEITGLEVVILEMVEGAVPQSTTAAGFFIDDEVVPPLLSNLPESRFEVLWNPEQHDLSSDSTYRVFVRMLGLSGETYDSNGFLIRPNAVAGGVALVDGNTSLVDDAIAPQSTGAGIEPLRVIRATIRWPFDGIQRVSLFVKSNGADPDPLFVNERLIDSFEPNGQRSIEGIDQFVSFFFDGSELRACEEYTVRARFELVNGVIEFERIVRASCADLVLRALPVYPEQCGAPSLETVRVNVNWTLDDRESLDVRDIARQVLLTVGVRDVDSSDPLDILFNVNDPQANATGPESQFDLDTSAYLVDQELVATLTDENGDTSSRTVIVPILRTPPEVSLVSPQGGFQCANRYASGNSANGLLSGVELAGRIDSSGSPHTFIATTSSVTVDGVESTSQHIENRYSDVLLGISGNDESSFTRLSDGENLSQARVIAGGGSSRTSGLFTVAELRDSGTATVEVAAYDWSGVKQCAVVDFSYDAEVEGAGLNLPVLARGNERLPGDATPGGLPIYSPNGDGVLDTVIVDVSVAEPATMHWQITALGSDSVLAEPFADVSLIPGTQSFQWNGQLDTGLAPDGAYQVLVRLVDDCGNEFSESYSIEIDNTPPQVAINFPTAADALGLVVEPRGSVSDLNLESYVLTADDIPISTSDEPLGVENGILGVWNTFGLAGGFSLVLEARDTAGNVVSSTVGVSIPDESEIISLLDATGLFSPNGDGRLDQSNIRVQFEGDALATAEVVDASGSVVIATLATAVAYPIGLHTLQWDGLTAGGSPAPEGNYLVRITAQPSAGGGFEQVASVTTVIDRTPPLISVTGETNGVVPLLGEVAVPQLVGGILDAHFRNYTVTLQSTPTGDALTALAGGSVAPISVLASFASEQFQTEGIYTLRIVAEDRADNLVQRDVALLVDVTAPQITLLAPDAGTGYRVSDTDAIEISGTIVEPNLQEYSVSLSTRAAGAAPIVEQNFNSAPNGSTLGALSLAGIADGDYRITLRAVDQGGLSSAESRDIFIDNTAPTANISQPAEGGYVTEPGSILGVANDTYIAEYELGLASGNGAGRFNRLVLSSNAVASGSLFYWSDLPADGDYVLELKVRDLLGNESTETRQFSVDTNPPGQPENLVADLDKASQNVILSWTPVAATDLVGYRLVRNGVAINGGALLPAATYTDNALPEGEYEYVVIAVDQAGLVSDPSEPLQLTVDVTPPEVRLASPGNGELVSGLVSVTGQAFSTPDFKDYRILVGTTSNNMTEVHLSTLPVTGGELAQLNTLALPEGSDYIIELRASDLTDNEAVTSVSVVVDNTAPGAPTGLVATPTGSDVGLVWQPPADIDVLGYLIFRNDTLVNAANAVGDLRPVAIATTTLNDSEVADGTYNYRVVAIDEAGNLSNPSELVEVTIDTRDPAAVINSPAGGESFEDSLFINATVEDQDVASVAFEYREAGTGPWLAVGVDTSAPFNQQWDSSALPFGDYQIRAVATDNSNNTDPAPGVVAVVKTDLNRPESVTGFDLIVNGGTVDLSWSAVPDADLDGYLVLRRLASEEAFVRVTPSPISALSFSQLEVDDGDYVYSVVAVDASGNESETANQTRALVFTPRFNEPFSPTLADMVEVSGISVPEALAQISASSAVGNTTETIAIDALGIFALPVTLEQGSNNLTVLVTHPDGFVSKPASYSVRRSALPDQVTGVTAEQNAAETAIDVSWTAVGGAEPIGGYQIYRDELAIAETAEIALASAVSSAGNFAGFTPDRAIDGEANSFAYWAPQSPFEAELDVQFAASSWVTEVEIEWSSESYTPFDFDVQLHDGDRYVTVERVRGADNEAISIVSLSAPYYTDRLRLQIVRHRFGSSTFRPVRLTELRVRGIALVTGTSFSDLPDNGFHTYQVSAVNDAGFEGQRSELVSTSFGDVTAPNPVSLSGNALNSDVQLSWAASSATDVAVYQLIRNGEVVSEQSTTGFVDQNLTNGAYSYLVRVVDQQGNVSDDSNVVSLLVDVGLLPAPQNLTAVGSVSSSPAAVLEWQAAPVGDPVGYQLERSVNGSDYEEFITTTELTASDSPLLFDTEYSYRVRALDAIGNASAPSNVADLVLFDLTAPEAPVIEGPTTTGLPIAIQDSIVRVTGRAEPGSSVFLLKNSSIEGPVIASASPTTVTQPGISVLALEQSETGLVAALLREADGRSVLALEESGGWREVTNSTATGFEMTDVIWFGERLVVSTDVGFDALTPLRAITLDGQVERFTTLNDPFIDQFPVDGVIGSRFGGQLLVLSVGGFFESLVQLDVDFGEFFQVFVNDRQAWSQFGSMSPDGSKMAYVANDGAGGRTLYVYDFNFDQELTYTLNSEPGVEDFGRVAWFADSDALVITTAIGGKDTLSQYRLSTNEQVELVNDPRGSADRPSLSPTDQLLTYRLRTGTGAQLVNVDLTSQSVSDVFSTPVSSSLDQSVTGAGGLIGFVDAGVGVRLVQPAGGFVFDRVGIELGSNLITAFAVDPSGNASIDSLPIEVTRLERARPDLEVDVVIDRTLPIVGEQVPVSVTVANIGSEVSEATEVQVDAVGADGSSVRLASETVGVLAAGSQVSVNTLWSAVVLGDHTIVVTVDPANTQIEQAEGNNTASQTATVVEDAAPLLGLLLSPSQRGGGSFVANELLSAEVTLVNAGSLFDGTLQVRIVDGAGVEVAELLNESVEGLTYGGELERSVSWNTGTTFPGDYQIEVQLLDANGAAVASAQEAFNLVGMLNLLTAMTSDRSVYPSQSPVLLDATIFNASETGVFIGASASVNITNLLGESEYESTVSLAQIFAGDTVNVTFNWATDNLPPGEYPIELDVFDAAGDIVAESALSVVIAESDPILFGAVVTDQEILGQGEVLSVAYAIENRGNAALPGVALTLQLTDLATNAVIESQDLDTVLPYLGATSGTVTFNTAELSIASYEVAFSYQVQVNGTTFSGDLDRLLVGVSDTTPPAIALAGPSLGDVVNSDRVDIIANVVDADNSVASVEISFNGADPLPAPPGAQAIDTYQLPLSSLGEGDHTASIVATDSQGNVSPATVTEFVVDNTPPTVQISGVENGEVYDAPVQPIITASDPNFESLSLQLNGENFVSGTQILLEDEYRLVIVAEDQAGNATRDILLFDLDLTAATITIEGVDNGALYNMSLVPVITVTDNNIASTSITLNGVAFESGTEIVAEGDYVLAVSTTDTLGVVTEAQIEFTIDLTPPAAPIVLSPQNDDLLNQPVTDVTGTTEPGSLVRLVSSNGTDVSVVADATGAYLFAGVPLGAGETTLSVTATDQANNESVATTVQVTLNSGTDAELTGGPGVDPRVLIWAPQRHSVLHANCYWGHHTGHHSSYDHYGSDLEAVLEMTAEAYDDDGIPYLIVRDAWSFRTALRSGKWNVVNLLELDDARAHRLWIPGALAIELRAAVASGTGLTVTATRPWALSSIDDMLGVRVKFRLRNPLSVELADTSVTTAADWTISGDAVWLSRRGGWPKGVMRVSCGNYVCAVPAMIVDRYGEGDTSIMGFNPATVDDRAAAKLQIIQLARYSAPDTSLVVPGGVLLSQWFGSELTAPQELRFSETLGSGLEHIEAIDGVLVGNNEAQWLQSLTSGTSTGVTSLLQVPDEIGEFSVLGALTTVSPINSLAENSYLVPVDETIADLEERLADSIRALPAYGVRRFYRNHAAFFVDRAAALPHHSPWLVDIAIFKLAIATHDLQRIGATEQVALAGELMRSYQARWSAFQRGDQ